MDHTDNLHNETLTSLAHLDFVIKHVKCISSPAKNINVHFSNAYLYHLEVPVHVLVNFTPDADFCLNTCNNHIMLHVSCWKQQKTKKQNSTQM